MEGVFHGTVDKLDDHFNEVHQPCWHTRGSADGYAAEQPAKNDAESY